MKKHFLLLGLMFSGIIQTACTAQQGCAKISTCGNTDCSTSKNTFLYRSFSSDSTLHLFEEKDLFNAQSERDEWFGTFSAATKYSQNFGQKCNSCKNLGAYPFWSGTNTMTVGNNKAINGIAPNLDAYQFGLGDLTIENDDQGNPIFGTISLNPRVQHVGTDFLLYFTHKKNEHGFFFKLNAPLGALIINPKLTEQGVNPDGKATVTLDITGTAPGTPEAYDANYPRPLARYTSLSQAFLGGDGCCSDSFGGTVDKGFLLNYGRIASGRQSVVKFADVSASLGYNVWANDKGLIGIAFKGTCPTGNVPTAQYMLEPIFGRAGAWGVGGELMAHYQLWENDAETKRLNVWLQGEVLHLMPGRTPNMRSFDLKQNGPGSKYLLLQYYQQESDGTLTPSKLTQAINITTLPVVSKIKVEGSVALMLELAWNNWNVGVTGEFWGRSKEFLSIDMCAATDLRRSSLNEYVVLGRQVATYDADLIDDFITDSLTELTMDLCQPTAMICSSLDAYKDITSTGDTEISYSTTLPLPADIVSAQDMANHIPSNVNDALDIAGAAAAKVMTGKVTGSIGYVFKDYAYAPSISIFGGAEFTPRCSNNAVQYWSAGIQMGLNF